MSAETSDILVAARKSVVARQLELDSQAASLRAERAQLAARETDLSERLKDVTEREDTVVSREAELSAALTELAKGQKELLEKEAQHRKVHAHLVRYVCLSASDDRVSVKPLVGSTLTCIGATCVGRTTSSTADQ